MKFSTAFILLIALIGCEGGNNVEEVTPPHRLLTINTFEKEIFLSLDSPENIEYGIKLLEISKNKVVTIVVMKSSRKLYAKPGQIFSTILGDEGKIRFEHDPGLILKSVNHKNGTVILSQLYCEYEHGGTR